MHLASTFDLGARQIFGIDRVDTRYTTHETNRIRVAGRATERQTLAENAFFTQTFQGDFSFFWARQGAKACDVDIGHSEDQGTGLSSSTKLGFISLARNPGGVSQKCLAGGVDDHARPYSRAPSH